MWPSSVSKSLLMVVLAFAPVSALADSDHAHAKGPHGGVVKSFGKTYHIEGVRDGSKVRIFVLDEDGEKVAKIEKHSGGQITVLAAGEPKEKVELSGSESVSEIDVKVPAKGKVTVLVSLKIGKGSTSAKFVFD